jgi:creatinine amidohydrolase
MFLERMKTTDFDLKKKYTFVIPMGSTEQHGPFLPLGTDSFLADRIVQDAEAEFSQIIFLPTLRVTCSEEHEGFLGTVWITKETMNKVLFDICNSLTPCAKTIVLTSFHGGNLGLLNRFVLENKKAFGKVQVIHLAMGSEATEDKMREMIGGPTDAHAGNVEISMMLAQNESLVGTPPADYPKHIIEDGFATNRVKDFSEDGIVDNHPKWVVSKEKGKK